MYTSWYDVGSTGTCISEKQTKLHVPHCSEYYAHLRVRAHQSRLVSLWFGRVLCMFEWLLRVSVHPNFRDTSNMYLEVVASLLWPTPTMIDESKYTIHTCMFSFYHDLIIFFPSKWERQCVTAQNPVA